MTPTIVLKIGGEGGSIAILTRAGDAVIPEYAIRLRDQSLTFLQGAETDEEIRLDTAWTDSGDEAITALGRWPWPMLVPVTIHPDYAERVLVAVEKFRGQDGRRGVDRWTAACRRRSRV